MRTEMSATHWTLLPWLLIILLSISSTASQAEEADADFQTWLQALIAEARERDVSEDLIQQVLVPVTPIPQVVSNDRNQAEFVETLDMYLERRVTDWRINTGRARLAQRLAVLEAV